MAGIKELRLRIKSIGNIKQITRAMEMVATTKLRRFQDRAIASRPYAEEIAGLIGRLAGGLGEELGDRVLFNEGEGDKVLCLIISSDRGLCGAYNANLFRKLESWMGEQTDAIEFFAIGKKAEAYLDSSDYTIAKSVTEPPLEQIDYRNAAVIAAQLVRAFETGEYKSVWIMGTDFVSMARYVPRASQFLPIEASALGAGDDKADGDVILEPSAGEIFDALVPRYLETQIYNLTLESLTSEYASRRFAMKNATEAANDMQAVLKGVYNRKRQEGITTELLDIVGGAAAVAS
ncbi:MAG: ATP synthase F1 subunit gamma [Planctomycetota bacterium]|nr:ATP synthase F1 subunit gamma [Planctomycetota bacterium]